MPQIKCLYATCSSWHIDPCRFPAIVPKNSPKRWALYAHGVGNQCPAHGLSMPSTWSLSAHVVSYI